LVARSIGGSDWRTLGRRDGGPKRLFGADQREKIRRQTVRAARLWRGVAGDTTDGNPGSNVPWVARLEGLSVDGDWKRGRADGELQAPGPGKPGLEFREIGVEAGSEVRGKGHSPADAYEGKPQ
jgi:hypothetical protein